MTVCHSKCKSRTDLLSTAGDMVATRIEKIGMNPHFVSVFRRGKVQRVEQYRRIVWLVDRVIGKSKY